MTGLPIRRRSPSALSGLMVSSRSTICSDRDAGNDILQQAALRLQAAMDEHSVVTRFGGDQFAILMPMVFQEAAARAKSAMLTEVLSAPYDVGERAARLSASVGCSLFQSGDETAEILINKAETALYHAKRTSRGSIVVYSQQMEEAAQRATSIEQALRRAVATGDVESHFQPNLSIWPPRQAIGFECLAPLDRS